MYNLATILKIPELWTTTERARIIAETKVRGVLKSSWRWLLNCVKQKIPKVLVDCVVKAKTCQKSFLSKHFKLGAGEWNLLPLSDRYL